MTKPIRAYLLWLPSKEGIERSDNHSIVTGGPPTRGLPLFALFHRLTRKRVCELFEAELVVCDILI